MENIGGRPDAAEAREALAGIREVQRAVRDTPWPAWLYVVNGVLVGAMALTSLLEERRPGALWAVAAVVIVVNITAGYRMGIPWVLPASRGFLAGVAVSVACVVTAVGVADGTERAWPVVALAAAATAAYLAGSVAHRRSTGRPR